MPTQPRHPHCHHLSAKGVEGEVVVGQVVGQVAVEEVSGEVLVVVACLAEEAVAAVAVMTG